MLIARSRWGFRLRVLGLNPVAAHRAGISAALLGGSAIVLSGAFAGLAGGVMLTGSAYRLTPAFANNVGWTGLLVALVARNDAGAAIATALLFGALEAGGSFLSTAGPPTDLVSIVQALVVLGVVFPPAFLQLRQIRRDRATARADRGSGRRHERDDDDPVERGAPERAPLVRRVRRVRRRAGGHAQHLGRGDDALRRRTPARSARR